MRQFSRLGHWVSAGLAGLHAEAPQLGEAAKRLTVPVEFLAQWDDELAPRARASLAKTAT